MSARELVRAGPVVCVVDPDPAVRDGLRLLLGTLGVQVHLYESAEALLEDLDGPSPLCVIADVRLPGMSGIDLLLRLREPRRSNVPMILMSSDADVSLAVQAIREGAVDLIEKPYVDVLVLQHVERLLLGSESR